MTTMTRATQATIGRAIKAAHAQGLEVIATEIAPDGTIRLTHTEAASVKDPWDKWKASRNEN